MVGVSRTCATTGIERHPVGRRPSGCTFGGMTESPDHDRVARRAELLPEESRAGSDDPMEQAEATLEESDERTEDPEKARHESAQTPDQPPAEEDLDRG